MSALVWVAWGEGFSLCFTKSEQAKFLLLQIKMIYLLVHVLIFFFLGFFFQWLSQLCIYLSKGDLNCYFSVNWQPALKVGEFRVFISLSIPSQLLWQHICSRRESALSHPYCSYVLLNCYTVDRRNFYAWSLFRRISEFWQKAVYPPQFTVTRELRQIVIVSDGSLQESWRGNFCMSRE